MPTYNMFTLVGEKGNVFGTGNDDAYNARGEQLLAFDTTETANIFGTRILTPHQFGVSVPAGVRDDGAISPSPGIISFHPQSSTLYCVSGVYPRIGMILTERPPNLYVQSFDSATLTRQQAFTVNLEVPTYVGPSHDMYVASAVRYGQWIIGRYGVVGPDNVTHPQSLFAIHYTNARPPIFSHNIDIRAGDNTPTNYSPGSHFKIGEWLYWVFNDGANGFTSVYQGMMANIRTRQVRHFSFSDVGAYNALLGFASYDGTNIFVGTTTGLYAYSTNGTPDPESWTAYGNLSDGASYTPSGGQTTTIDVGAKCFAVRSTTNYTVSLYTKVGSGFVNNYLMFMNGTSIVKIQGGVGQWYSTNDVLAAGIAFDDSSNVWVTSGFNASNVVAMAAYNYTTGAQVVPDPTLSSQTLCELNYGTPISPDQIVANPFYNHPALERAR